MKLSSFLNKPIKFSKLVTINIVVAWAVAILNIPMVHQTLFNDDYVSKMGFKPGADTMSASFGGLIIIYVGVLIALAITAGQITILHFARKKKTQSEKIKPKSILTLQPSKFTENIIRIATYTAIIITPFIFFIPDTLTSGHFLIFSFIHILGLVIAILLYGLETLLIYKIFGARIIILIASILLLFTIHTFWILYF